jgi:hypothetical protein
MTPAALTRPSAPDSLRPDRMRPDARPDRLRPDPLRPDSARPDRLRPDPLRPDARPDRAQPEPGRPQADPMAPAALEKGRRRPDPLRPDARPEPGRPDPIRTGRDALLASLERPLGAPRDTADAQKAAAEPPRRARGAAALIGAPVPTTSPFEDDPDGPAEVPAVPSLAVLRPRLKAQPDNPGSASTGEKPRKRLPSWDDVLFGSAPARESS